MFIIPKDEIVNGFSQICCLVIFQQLEFTSNVIRALNSSLADNSSDGKIDKESRLRGLSEAEQSFQVDRVLDLIFLHVFAVASLLDRTRTGEHSTELPEDEAK